MFRKIVTLIIATIGCILPLAACDSGKLSTSESCALIVRLSIQHNVEEKWNDAYISILDGDAQPAFDAIEASTEVYREVSDRTGDQKMHEAMETSISQYQSVLDAMDGRTLYDAALTTDLDRLYEQMLTQRNDYVSDTCRGSIANPNPVPN